ncbi:MAG: DUF3185 domain-containing protein [Acidobacteriaceae bacterium]
MKAATLVGILLIVVGIIGFAVGGISFTHRKKDVDMGPVQISHNKTETMPISPILSTVALIGGIGLVVVGARSSRIADSGQRSEKAKASEKRLAGNF